MTRLRGGGRKSEGELVEGLARRGQRLIGTDGVVVGVRSRVAAAAAHLHVHCPPWQSTKPGHYQLLSLTHTPGAVIAAITVVVRRLMMVRVRTRRPSRSV